MVLRLELLCHEKWRNDRFSGLSIYLIGHSYRGLGRSIVKTVHTDIRSQLTLIRVCQNRQKWLHG